VAKTWFKNQECDIRHPTQPYPNWYLSVILEQALFVFVNTKPLKLLQQHALPPHFLLASCSTSSVLLACFPRNR